MRKGALALGLAAALMLAVPAWAEEKMDQTGAQAEPARALTLQALALFERGRAHEEAEKRLDSALAAEDKGGVDLRALRAALHREAAAEAERLLQDAFPGGGEHVVGVTYGPGASWHSSSPESPARSSSALRRQGSFAVAEPTGVTAANGSAGRIRAFYGARVAGTPMTRSHAVFTVGQTREEREMHNAEGLRRKIELDSRRHRYVEALVGLGQRVART